MILTSNHTNLAASTIGRVKSVFFALGEAAQKKLYTAEYVPSSPGEWGLIFALLSLAHAAVGIRPNCHEMAHGATRRSRHHRTTGSVQMPHRAAVWAALRCCFRSATGFRSHNPLKPYREAYYGPEGQQCTKERKP
jgi:hypothetical protein